MPEQHRVEQGHVGGVGHQAHVQQRVVGQFPVDPQPDEVPRGPQRPVPLRLHRKRADRPQVNRIVDHVRRDLAEQPGQPVRRPLDHLRRRHVGHRVGVLESGFRAVEGRGQGEDGLAVLDRRDPAGGEGPPVSHPVDHVDERHRRIARPDEVRVQGVHRTVPGHGPACRDQRLPGHLAAEHPLPALIRAAAAEDVHLDLFQVEELQEPVERLSHRASQSSPAEADLVQETRSRPRRAAGPGPGRPGRRPGQVQVLARPGHRHIQ